MEYIIHSLAEPPRMIESQTSQVVETIEYSNVSIQCKAEAHPRATITWRRDDGSPIKLRGDQNKSINSDNNTTTTTNDETSNISGEPLKLNKKNRFFRFQSLPSSTASQLLIIYRPRCCYKSAKQCQKRYTILF